MNNTRTSIRRLADGNGLRYTIFTEPICYCEVGVFIFMKSYLHPVAGFRVIGILDWLSTNVNKFPVLALNTASTYWCKYRIQ